MAPLGQNVGIPEQRQIRDDRIVFCEGHVVRQARARHGDRDVVLELVVRPDHAVMHVGRVGGVVEEEQLARVLVQLGMRRDTVERHPAFRPELFHRVGVEPIALPALIEGRQDLAGMHDDIGRGGVLDAAMRAPARPGRQARVLGNAGPERLARLDLGHQPLGAHKAVLVTRLAVAEGHGVDHAVAVERVIKTDRTESRILAVPDIDPVDILRDLADHFEIVGVILVEHRRPGTGRIGMVRIGIAVRDRAELHNRHRGLL